MNLVLYVPFKGTMLFWHLAADDLGWVQYTLIDKYQGAVSSLFDGIKEMHCHDEETFPALKETED